MTIFSGRRWVLDTEGSGQNPNVPIQLAAVEMEGSGITGRTHVWYFRPQTSISPYATKIHGITDNAISKHPTFEEQRDEVIETLGNLPIIGHSVSSELQGMRIHMPGWTPEQAICTLRMARRVFPDQKLHKLTALAEQLDIADLAKGYSGQKPHHALYDAYATAFLFQYFARLAGDKIHGMIKTSDVVASERAKKARQERLEHHRQLKLALREERRVQQ